MNYKGWLIEPKYAAGVTKNNAIRNRKQAKTDVTSYKILDPMNDNRPMGFAKTVSACKTAIEEYQIEMGMPNNLPATWGKLK